ncbi:MAG: hypothetical protein Q9218_006435 [Villophora microphyllina]
MHFARLTHCAVELQALSEVESTSDTNTLGPITTSEPGSPASTVPKASSQPDSKPDLDKEARKIEHLSPKTTRGIWYHLYSLWLFTFSDLKTIVIPKTIFAVATLCSGRSLTKDARPGALGIVGAVPLALLWNWLNLLPLAMSNQCDTTSAVEDKLNKPWRPIPAGRLTVEETRVFRIVAYVVAITTSITLGGFPEAVALVVEGWMYNALNGANGSLLARNMLCAVGYMTFASGSARAACLRVGTELREDSILWFILLAGMIATSIQFQDLYDQKGDAVRRRRTVPLVAGDRIARLTIAVPTAAWSWIGPRYWKLSLPGFILPAVLGAIIILRLYWYRRASEDKRSFIIWNAWVMSMYFLPSLGNLGATSG